MAKKTTALARLQSRITNAKKKERAMFDMAIGKGAGVITAAGTGAFEHKIPATVAKIPTKLIGAGVLYLISAYTKGAVSTGANAAGDALKDIYAFKVAMQARMGTAKPFVAGENDEGDETGYVVEM